MSDLHYMLNDWAVPKMSVFGTKCAGHEGSGVIVKVGDQVKNLKPGMRAGYKVSKPAVNNSTATDAPTMKNGVVLTHPSQSKTLAAPANSAAMATKPTAQRPC
jgi:NADPH:quinone reductase-like Zn-dependent oxidoreductase